MPRTDRHFPERELYPGSVTIGLAAVGAWPPVGVAQVAALVSGALAFDWSIGINGVTYPQLYAHVLPYRGIRVPARFSAVVGSMLVLLAAYGCRRLFSWPRGGAAQSMLFVCVSALAFVDLRPVTDLRPYFPTAPSIYARVTPDMVLAEFPRTRIIDFMYFSTGHWAHLLRGYSGFMPIDNELEDAMDGFPSPASLAVLRRRGATHLTYNCAFERSQTRCAVNLEHLDDSPDLQLIASEKWQGADVRLYRFK